MNSVLYISCSPKMVSISLGFADEVVGRLLQRHPKAELHRRDLGANPPPFVDADFCAAIMSSDTTGTAGLHVSDMLIQELEQADAVVIATPMHNYSVPAVLKAWIDQIVRIHRSFASTPAGKIGRLRDRPVYVVVASGGWFSGPSPTGAPAQPDFLTPYLRAILGTIGLRDIHFLTLEGVTRGPDLLQHALINARDALDGMLPVMV